LEGKISEGTANHRRDCISEAIRLLEELSLLTRRAGAPQVTFAASWRRGCNDATPFCI
jgi:hypothetical protein